MTCELLRARSPIADKITMTGAVDAVTGEQLRNVAHVFTAHNCTGPITNQEEAFGVSIVEAMAAGLPIVSARNGSLPEIVDHGVNGYLVDPGNVDEHAQALLTLYENPSLRASMGHESWSRARQHFTIQDEIRSLQRILEMT